MKEIEVQGHSGCQIEIAREGDELYVYKSSHDEKYLSRLVLQAEKQRRAATQEYQHVRVPQIFGVERDAEHVSVKMEYVYSRNFVEFFESAGFEQTGYFVRALEMFVERELSESPVQAVSTAVVTAKFEDVCAKIASNPHLAGDAEIARLVNQCRSRFEAFSQRGTIDIPVGTCHGDLTFSNILFNGNNYYLIDFLDSFIETPLMDIVKIRQDTAHLWSQLMYTKRYDRLRLNIICEKIDHAIDRYFGRYAWYGDNYGIFQLLNLLRVLQYAHEERVTEYLKREIGGLLEGKGDAPKAAPEMTCRGKGFSLIVPAAADNADTPDVMPYVFGLDRSGVMLCVRALQGLNLGVFDNIYITILRKHAERFCVDDLLAMQLRRFGMGNARIVVLDEPTRSQTETIYRTIRQEGIGGGIFIKDADGYFEGEVRRENAIAIYPMESMPLLDPQHKSYVAVDDMYYVTNMIEKRIIGHHFNAGGSCFENAADYCAYYERLSQKSDKVYVSHIIYQMLLDRKRFRPIEVNGFLDWGSPELLGFYAR